MIIKRLKLVNYRNYDSVDLELNNKLNILIGDNAQGKTNILESIYVLSITKSFLNNNDKNLIKYEKDYCAIEAEVMIDDILKKFKIIINSRGKIVSINNKEIKKMSDYISNLKVIIFSPDNIKMIKDSPYLRRKFLNIEISQIDNKYTKYLMDYNNLISQKNEYLKNNIDLDINYIDIVNKNICKLSIELTNMRNDFINDINKYLSDIFYEITGIDGLRIKYLSSVDYYEDNKKMNDVFLDRLNSYLDREKKYKISLIGPHRDDFIFVLDNKNLAFYGSQGQMRCAILSLKLAEVKLFCNLSNNYPVLLLDDIFSELDIKRKNNLIKYINDNVQTIITTTDLNLIDDKLVEKASIFNIENANIDKAS